MIDFGGFGGVVFVIEGVFGIVQVIDVELFFG